MNENDSQTIMQELLSAVGITRVVIVDDQASSIQFDFPPFLVALRGIGSEELTNLDIPELNGIPWPDDDNWDVARAAVGQRWDEWTNEQRASICQSVGMRLEKNSSSTNMQLVADAFPGTELRLLGPEEWELRFQELFDDTTEHKTLFLIDLNLTNERQGEGMSIVSSILQQGLVGCYCGLLSEEFAPHEEQDRWKQLTDSSGLLPELQHSFATVSKKGLGNGDERFIGAVRRVVLSRYFYDLQKNVSDILKSSIDAASTEIGEWSVFDLEHALLRIPAGEGVSELDTLVRVIDAHYRNNLSSRLWKDPNNRDRIGILRRLSELLPTPTPSTRLRQIQEAELYVHGDQLLDMRVPIDLGDVFEKTNSTGEPSRYLLLGQPCDLAVRNGERARGFSIVTVAKIKKQIDPKLKPAQYELIYFPSSTHATYYVDLADTYFVPLIILDLCVFSDDGRALARCTNSLDAVTDLLPSWQERAKNIQIEFTNLWQDAERFAASDISTPDGQSRLADVLGAILPKPLNSAFLLAPSIDFNRREVLYPLKRAMRLRQPRAGDFLVKYAQHISRMAFEVDLNRTVVP